MELTNEQYNALLPYKEHFETATKAQWARNPGNAALDLIHSIYCQVTGLKTSMNKGCSHCILTLLKDMGRIFLAEYDRRQKVVKVEVKDVEVGSTKVVVAEKPKRKYTRKPKSQE